MKKLRIIMCLAAILSITVGGRMAYIASDSHLRDMVVKLQSGKGSCSGVKVVAPSGEAFILTAGHCKALLDDEGDVTAVQENGRKDTVHIVEISKDSDLMLLSSPDKDGVVLAKSVDKHQRAHSMTHGRGFPSYRTDGELLEQITIEVRAFDIVTAEDAARCLSDSRNSIVPDFLSEVCIAKESVMATTVGIVPGSSGGPVVNEYGSLVGIVSASDGVFGYLVSLDDVKLFLAGR